MTNRFKIGQLVVAKDLLQLFHAEGETPYFEQIYPKTLLMIERVEDKENEEYAVRVIDNPHTLSKQSYDLCIKEFWSLVKNHFVLGFESLLTGIPQYSDMWTDLVVSTKFELSEVETYKRSLLMVSGEDIQQLPQGKSFVLEQLKKTPYDRDKFYCISVDDVCKVEESECYTLLRASNHVHLKEDTMVENRFWDLKTNNLDSYPLQPSNSNWNLVHEFYKELV